MDILFMVSIVINLTVCRQLICCGNNGGGVHGADLPSLTQMWSFTTSEVRAGIWKGGARPPGNPDLLLSRSIYRSADINLLTLIMSL